MTNRKTYSVIYADPPWQYRVWRQEGAKRTAASHYCVMDLQSLKHMNIPAICAANSVLLMWATMPMLPESIELGEAWGFSYKTVAFTWIKTYKHLQKPFVGMGHYTRGNAELVLLFTKGKPLARQSRNVEQVVMSKIGAHSEKPAEVRKRIEQLFGDVPRVELFARSRPGLFAEEEFAGWDVFGNQVKNSIELI